MPSQEKRMLEKAEALSAAARQHCLKVDQMRIFDFLNFASVGGWLQLCMQQTGWTGSLGYQRWRASVLV
jgi:hypothetical protein